MFLYVVRCFAVGFCDGAFPVALFGKYPVSAVRAFRPVFSSRNRPIGAFDIAVGYVRYPSLGICLAFAAIGACVSLVGDVCPEVEERSTVEPDCMERMV